MLEPEGTLKPLEIVWSIWLRDQSLESGKPRFDLHQDS